MHNQHIGCAFQTEMSSWKDDPYARMCVCSNAIVQKWWLGLTLGLSVCFSDMLKYRLDCLCTGQDYLHLSKQLQNGGTNTIKDVNNVHLPDLEKTRFLYMEENICCNMFITSLTQLLGHI